MATKEIYTIQVTPMQAIEFVNACDKFQTFLSRTFLFTRIVGERQSTNEEKEKFIGLEDKVYEALYVNKNTQELVFSYTAYVVLDKCYLVFCGNDAIFK